MVLDKNLNYEKPRNVLSLSMNNSSLKTILTNGDEKKIFALEVFKTKIKAENGKD